jgi:hypothetical protein
VTTMAPDAVTASSPAGTRIVRSIRYGTDSESVRAPRYGYQRA